MTVAGSPSPVQPARVAVSRRVRRRRTIGGAALLVVLAAGGYTAACALTPMPKLHAALAVPAETVITADTAAVEAAIAAQPLPTAIGWAHEDTVWATDSTPHSLASLSKLITVLVCQDAEPLAPGTDGPTYVWTEADAQRQAELVANDGVAYPIPVGTEISLRDMLKLIFLPSANDFAAAYAYSVFGDNETFLAAVDDWAERNGITSLSFVEPTGMDEGNQASPDDLVRIARLVLENPALTEFTGMQSASIPGIGEIENTNPLLGEPGIIGLKTGRTTDAGFNLIVAQTTDVDGRELIEISVTLGRPSLDARAESGREMLDVLATLPQPLMFVAADEPIGSVTTWTGAVVPLVTASAAEGVLVPGESATRTLQLDEVGAAPAGTTVGEIAVASPTGAASVQVITGAEITEPDLWWRLTHPAALFG